MAEQLKPRPAQESKDKEKAEKLKKLKELEAKLQSLNSQESSTQATPEEKQIQSAESAMQTLDSELEAVESEIQTQMKRISAKNTAVGADIERELAQLEKEVAAEQVTEVVKSNYEKLLDLHPWLEQPQYGFMFAMPNAKKNKKDFESWQEEWSQVLLDYARVALLHIMYPKNLLTEKPFNKFQDRNKSVEALTETLVNKKIAEWLDRKKEMLRIYWKSLEEWAGLLADWARDTGKTEPIIMAEIRESEEEFKDLPEDDLKKIFKILEKQKKAQIIPLETGEWSIKIKSE